MTLINTLEQKAVGLRILNLGMDTQTPTGKLMLTVLGGVAKVKAAGKYKGRKPLDDALREEVVRFADSGLTKSKIAHQLNIGEATVYRILSAKKKSRQESLHTR